MRSIKGREFLVPTVSVPYRTLAPPATPPRLIFGSVLERFPGLRLLVARGGGVLPYLVGRLDAAWQSDVEVNSGFPCPPSTYAKMLYFDGRVYYPPALKATLALVGLPQ